MDSSPIKRTVAGILSLCLLASSVSAQEHQTGTRFEREGRGDGVKLDHLQFPSDTASAHGSAVTDETSPQDLDLGAVALLDDAVVQNRTAAEMPRTAIAQTAGLDTIASSAARTPSATSARMIRAQERRILTFARTTAERLKSPFSSQGSLTAMSPASASLHSPLRHALMTAAVAGFLAISPARAEEPPASGEILYSDFLARIDKGQVNDVMIQGSSINGHYANGGTFSTYAPADPGMMKHLLDHHVQISATPIGGNLTWTDKIGSLLLTWLPFAALIGVWIYLSRMMQRGGGGGGAGGFGRSRAKLLTEAHGRVTFQDVAGVDEAKRDLEEIVEFLRDPGKFQRLGGKIPRGVLLVGPPGTGKTLMARAVAGEAGVPFFTISGSDFVEMFVGVGASRVRDMFEQAKKNAPCIIFIDEIDAVGRHRGAGLGGGNDEREQTLNQLLVEMDGFEANEGIILMAATNRPDVLDPALLRPGRFDRQVVVPNPDIVGREQILNVHVRKVPLAPDVNLKTIAKGTPGFSGADLMNLVNEAALMAASRNKRMVTAQEFEDAKDKIMMGAVRKTMAMTEDEKLLTAYHEGGHAIVALNVKATDPVHKATIIPRGRALGMVMQLPERDQVSMSLEQMTSRLAILMGGRVAEEMIFGKEKVTSGASSDIEQATKLARAMVTRWGFGQGLGPVAYGENQQEVFMGHSVARQQNASEDTVQKIDAEIRRYVDAGYADAKRILTEKRADLETLARGLMDFETLAGQEIKDLLAGKPPVR